MNSREKKIIVFDASILVNAYVTGSLFRTGLWRVSDKILKGLIESGKYTIYLYDVYGRERELRTKIACDYGNSVKIFPLDSMFKRNCSYLFSNLADKYKHLEDNAKNRIVKKINKICKNGFRQVAKFLNNIDRCISREREINFLSSHDLYLSTYYPLPNKSYFKQLRKR